MAVSTMRIGSIGVTEKSLWFEQCSPRAMALAIGLMRPARSGPRLARCTSPKKKACTVKKLGLQPQRHILLKLAGRHELRVDDHRAVVLLRP